MPDIHDPDDLSYPYKQGVIDMVEFFRARIAEDAIEASSVTATDRSKREVEAKQRLLRNYDRTVEAAEDAGNRSDPFRRGYHQATRDALTDAVTAYYGHPDYRTDWEGYVPVPGEL